MLNYSEGSMCRICHEGDEEEELVSPCDCAGTMGMLHISCLEQWLGSSKTTKCEICQFQFTVLKKPQSVRWVGHGKWITFKYISVILQR